MQSMYVSSTRSGSEPRAMSWAWLLAIPLAALIAGCDTQTQSEGAHVHGVASLVIAIDDPTSASIEFTSPAESIYGFEHEATSTDDIAARDKAISTLETRFDMMLVMPDALGCRIEDAAVTVEHDDDGDGDADHDDDVDRDGDEEHADNMERAGDDDDHDDDADSDAGDDHAGETVSGEHSEVRATYRLICSGDLAGAVAQVSIGQFFSGVESLNVTILSESGQRSVVLEGGVGSVDL